MVVALYNKIVVQIIKTNLYIFYAKVFTCIAKKTFAIDVKPKTIFVDKRRTDAGVSNSSFAILFYLGV